MGCTSQGWQVGPLATTRSSASNPSAKLDILLTGPSSTTICQLYPPLPGQHDPEDSYSGQLSDNFYFIDQFHLHFKVKPAQARHRFPITHFRGSGYQKRALTWPARVLQASTLCAPRLEAMTVNLIILLEGKLLTEQF
jgi:hypothetical protein